MRDHMLKGFPRSQLSTTNLHSRSWLCLALDGSTLLKTASWIAADCSPASDSYHVGKTAKFSVWQNTNQSKLDVRSVRAVSYSIRRRGAEFAVSRCERSAKPPEPAGVIVTINWLRSASQFSKSWR